MPTTKKQGSLTKCPLCGRVVRTRDDGTFTKHGHRHGAGMGGGGCRMWGFATLRDLAKYEVEACDRSIAKWSAEGNERALKDAHAARADWQRVLDEESAT